jgi:ectoine hydroxylase-related dioxygenase (phytanoyl-CoA dioxygenase family)
LRLLVGPELREKFDRQRYLLNQSIWHGELEDVRRESGRMVNAWHALDRAAEAAGALNLNPLVL